MKYLFIPSLLILCVIFSCKKYGEGYVGGTVYEVGTNLPIAGIPVTIGYYTGSQSPYVPVSTTHTDNSGHYLLYYDKKRGNESYQVNCTPDSLHLASNISSYLPEYKKETNGNIPMYPVAFLKLHIKKTTSLHNDHVIITTGNGSSGDLYYYSQTILNSNPFDTIIPVIKTYGNCTNYINWNIDYYAYSNSSYGDSSASFSGSVFINKGDTGVFTIQYQ